MSFAGGTDLLSLATDGAVTTAKAEMVGVKVLSSDEMKDVVGRSWEYRATEYTSIYKQVYGDVTERYMGKDARLYARRMNSNGATTTWLNYNQNGAWNYAYGTEAIRLLNLYSSTAKSRL